MNDWLCIVSIVYLHLAAVLPMLLDTNINVVTGFVICVFLVAHAPKVQRAWDPMETSPRNWLSFLILFGKKVNFFKQKPSFLINIPFGNVFQTFRVNKLNNANVCKTLS